MLKKILTLLLVFTATATFAQEKAIPSILPKPSNVKPGNTNIKFDFTRETKIIYGFDDNFAENAADELNRIAKDIFKFFKVLYHNS